jgi:hypothetical protein
MMRKAFLMRYGELMRTTVNIEDSSLEDIRNFALRKQQGLSEAVSELLREALKPKEPPKKIDATGLPTMPVQAGAGVVTLEIVNALRDEM